MWTCWVSLPYTYTGNACFCTGPCVCRRLMCSDGKKTQNQWACLMSALHRKIEREGGGEIPVGYVQQSAGQCSWLTSIQCTVWSVCLHVFHGSFCCFLWCHTDNNVCYFMWIIPVSVNTKHLCVAFTPQPSHMYVFFDTVVKGLFLFVAHSHSYARPSDEGDDRCSYPMWCRRCSASRRHRTATRVWRRKCHTLNHTLFLTILIHI